MLQSPRSLSFASDIGTSLFKGEQCFFEAQPFAADEIQKGIVRDSNVPHGQFGLQAMQCLVRVLGETLHNEITMRLKNPLAVAAHLAGMNRPGRTMALRPLHHRGCGNFKPYRHLGRR